MAEAKPPAMEPERPETRYSAYTAISAEGRRFGIVTCLRCGAAVMLDEDKGADIHDAWHAKEPTR